MVWSPLRVSRATLDFNAVLFALLMILLLVEMMSQTLGSVQISGSTSLVDRASRQPDKSNSFIAESPRVKSREPFITSR